MILNCECKTQYPDIFQWKSARKIEVDGICSVKFGPDLIPIGNGYYFEICWNKLIFDKNGLFLYSPTVTILF